MKIVISSEHQTLRINDFVFHLKHFENKENEISFLELDIKENHWQHIFKDFLDQTSEENNTFILDDNIFDVQQVKIEVSKNQNNSNEFSLELILNGCEFDWSNKKLEFSFHFYNNGLTIQFLDEYVDPFLFIQCKKIKNCF